MQIKEVLKKYLSKNRFARNIAFLASGTILSQIITLLAIPLLSRLYSPADFGVLATYASYLGILAVVANLRYQHAIPLPDSDREASALLILSIAVTVLITSIVLIVIILVNQRLENLMFSTNSSSYLIIIPIGVFFIGIYQALNYWAIRQKELKTVAKTKVLQSLMMLVVQVALFKISAFALILGHILGQSAGILGLGLPIIKEEIKTLKTITINEIVLVAKKYRKFPLISTWAGLLNSLGSLGPNLLFAILFSPIAAGLFFIANRIVTTPMTLLGTAIGQSFYTEAVESQQKGELAEFIRKVSRKLLGLVTVPALLIFLFGEEVTSYFLGSSWTESGKMIEWLSFMMAAQFITSPISSVFSITEQQLKGLILQLNLTIFRIGSIFIAYFQGVSVLDAVIYFSISSTFGYMVFFIFSVNVKREKE